MIIMMPTTRFFCFNYHEIRHDNLEEEEDNDSNLHFT